jgi:hypothetical protein
MPCATSTRSRRSTTHEQGCTIGIGGPPDPPTPPRLPAFCQTRLLAWLRGIPRDPGLTPMADDDDVRRLALALPGVEEIDCDGFDFRVGGQGFVWSYPERTPGRPRLIRTDIAVLYVGDEAEKQALLLGEPELFFTAPGYGDWPLVMLRLAEVDGKRLAELVTDAWRMRAPSDLAAALDADKRQASSG